MPKIIIPEYFLGVDPGASGAVSVIETASFSHIESVDFDKSKRGIPCALDHIVKKYGKKGTCVLAVEEVHAIFGSSAKSTFNFGFNLGLIHSVLQLNIIPFYLVPPKKWQGTLGLPSFKGLSVSERKALTAEAIEKRIPLADIRGTRGGVIDGRSDALGIALHLYLQHHNTEVCPYKVYQL